MEKDLVLKSTARIRVVLRSFCVEILPGIQSPPDDGVHPKRVEGVGLLRCSGMRTSRKAATVIPRLRLVTVLRNSLS